MNLYEISALKVHTANAITSANRIRRRLEAGEINTAILDMEWLLHDITRCQEVVHKAEQDYLDHEIADIRARIAAASGRS